MISPDAVGRLNRMIGHRVVVNSSVIAKLIRVDARELVLDTDGVEWTVDRQRIRSIVQADSGLMRISSAQA